MNPDQSEEFISACFTADELQFLHLTNSRFNSWRRSVSCMEEARQVVNLGSNAISHAAANGDFPVAAGRMPPVNCDHHV